MSALLLILGSAGPAVAAPAELAGGHAQRIANATFSPDGRLLLTAGGAEAKLWSTATGALQVTLPFGDAAFTPDGKGLVVWKEKALARLDLGGRVLWEAKSPLDLVEAATAAGQVMATDHGGTLRRFDLATGKPLGALDGFGQQLALSADGARAAGLGEHGGEVSVWNTATWKRTWTALAHAGRVSDVAFSADGRRVATAGDDGTVRLWDAAGAAQADVFDAPGDEANRGQAHGFGSVTFSPDGQRLAATVSDSWEVLVWRLPGGEREAALGPGSSTALAFTPDGKWLAWAHERTLRFQELGQAVGAAPAPPGEAAELRPDAVALSPKGLLATGGHGRGVQLWDVMTGLVVRGLPTPGPVSALAFSPDGALVAAGLEGGPVIAWDVSSGAVRHRLSGHGGEVAGLHFDARGAGLVSVDRTGTAFVWAVGDGHALRSWKTEGYVSATALSRDGALLATTGSARVQIWDVATGALRATLESGLGAATALAFAPDGRLAVGARGLALYDVTRGEVVRAFDEAKKLQAVALAFSADGATLLVAAQRMRFSSPVGHELSLWASSTGARLRSYAEPTEPIAGAALSPDGLTVASADGDGRARVWAAKETDPGLVLTPREVSEVAVAPPAEGRAARATALPSTPAAAIEVVVQTGHGAAVEALAFAPGGRLLASGGGDNRVVLWDLSAGMQLRSLVAHTKAVRAVAFRPGGLQLASASEDGTVVLWDAATGAPLRTLARHRRPVTALAFSPDGKTLATAGADHTVRLWPLDAAGPERMLRHGGPNAVAFHPAGRWLASGGADGAVRVWDAASGALVRTLAGTSEILALAFTSEGVLAASYAEGPVRLWDVGAGVEVGPPRAGVRVRSLAVGRDGELLGAADFKGVLRLGANRLPPLEGGRFVHTLATDPGLGLAAFAGGADIELYDLVRGTALKELRSRARPVTAVAVSSAHTLATVSGARVRLLDLALGKTLPTLAFESGFRVHAVAFSPDGSQLAVGGDDLSRGGLSLWETGTGRAVRAWPGHPGAVGAVAFSPDGALLASADGLDLSFGKGPPGGFAVRLWTAATGAPVAVLQGHTAPVHALAFSRDGTLAVSAGDDGTVRVWDVATRTQRRELHAAYTTFTSVAVSPRGDRLATGSLDGKVRVYAVDTGALMWSSSHGRERLALAFGGDELAVGGGDGSIAYFEAGSGRALRTSPAHGAAVSGVAFTPDGRLLVSGSSDATVVVAGAEGRPLARYVPLDEDGFALIAPTNEYLASKDSVGGVAFRVGDHAYPFEQFDLRFNRPHAVLGALGFISPPVRALYQRAFEKRLKRMHFTLAQLDQGDVALPRVFIDVRALARVTRDPTLSVEVRAEDPKAGLVMLQVSVNGAPLVLPPGAGDGGRTLRRKVAIPLASGLNRVQVSVVNALGAESLRETFDVTLDRKAAPRLFVATLGVSTYQTLPSLAYAAKDAHDLGAALSAGKGSFADVRVLERTNAQVTRESLAEVKAFLSQAGVDDSVVLFVAGHGLRDEVSGDYFFGTSDMDPLAPSKRGIPTDELDAVLEGPARRKLLLKDTCFSGEADADDLTGGGVAVAAPAGGRGFVRKGPAPELSEQEAYLLLNALFADLRRGSGAVVIASAGGNEAALESAQWKNGLFTWAVLESLAKGRAKVSHLRTEVTKRVQELSGGRQNPTSWHDNPDFDFALR